MNVLYKITVIWGRSKECDYFVWDIIKRIMLKKSNGKSGNIGERNDEVYKKMVESYL